MTEWSVDAVWDIETSQWDQFLCGALWTAKDGNRVFRDPGQLADALLALPAGAQVWAHNGGKFDLLWLIDYLVASGRVPRMAIHMSGSSASSAHIAGGPWFRDSARLIPMPLADAAPIAGPGRTKGDPGIAYEDMHAGMTKRQWWRVLDYQISDVELLRDVLFAIRDYAESHDIVLRGTVGGTAWATAQAWCDLDDAVWPEHEGLYQVVAPMYYGGRCELPILNADEIWRYDRKSAYPASIMLPIPIGEPKRVLDAAASRAFGRGRAGCYHVAITIPESHAPPLPFRHRGRLTYPFGRIEGTWSHLEIQHAIRCGGRVEKVYSGVTWPREEAKLKPYAQEVFRLRDSLPKRDKDSLGQWLKFLANSLTGKLGQSPDHKLVAIGDYADVKGYDPVGRSPWVWYREQWRLAKCAWVQWAGTLTARARIELHEQVLHAGQAWVYSDTDSVFATRALTRNLGDDIGDWAFEGKGLKWRAEAPKVYAYEGTDKKTGKPKAIAHAKGIPGMRDGKPVDMDVWNDYADGEPITNQRGVESLLVASRKHKGDSEDGHHKLFRRRNLIRTFKRSDEWVGARLRVKNAAHVTRAPHVKDLARLR